MSDVDTSLARALSDRYEIEREIGSGGMATVYLAHDVKHHRKVAVKVLRPEVAAAVGAERFLREIEVTARLNHPHILPLLDSGSAEDPTARPPDRQSAFLYYVMPYIEGESLRERLAREGELPIAEAVRVLREIVDALAKAHSQGVVHRDIKPDNVMLSDRHALVTDFGVAKAVSEATGRQDLTTAGVALGTSAYMAPEQAAADPHVDHRADIYAVGVLAYELLTGRPPFSGSTAQQVLAAHMTETPDPLTKHRETVPPALAQLVMRCLEKKPADRWQSADELLPQLEALATPSGGTTPLATATVAPRFRWIAVVAAAVILVLAGVWWQSQRGQTEPGAATEQAEVRVAVLMFENPAADENLEPWCDGIPEAISTRLGRIAGLAPIGQGSARKYRSGDVDYQVAAEELGADYLVEGSMRRAGERGRLTARLIAPETGEQLWADEYPLDLSTTTTDIFAAQGDIAGQIAGALGATLTPEKQDQLTEPQTESLRAYEFYLLGQHEMMGVYENPDRLWAAIEYFNRAIEADSGFALAYAGLAYGQTNRHFWGLDEQSELTEANDIARWAASKAMALDSGLAEARNALAGVLMLADMDWEGAERELLRALELNPGLGRIHSRYSLLLRLRGRYDEAVRAISRARELRFADDSYGATFASSLWGARQDSVAAEVFGTITAIGPNFDSATRAFRLAQLPWVAAPPTRFNEFFVYFDLGMSYDDALAALLDNLRHATADPGEVREYERKWGGLGWTGLWEAELHLEPPLSNLYQQAAAYARLGQNAEAVEALRTAYATGAPGLFWYYSNPFFTPLEDDPTYVELMFEIGLRP